MIRFMLIRHGQSTSNAGQPSSDVQSIALTALGQNQAERVADFFKESPGLIVHSPFLRAEQTAKPTMAKFPDTPHDVWPVQEFTYINVVGESTWSERFPQIEAYWRKADPLYKDGPYCESFSDLMDRVEDCAERLRTVKQGSVVVFCHCRFMQLFWWWWLTGRAQAMQTMETFWDTRHLIRIPNTGYIEGVVLEDGTLSLAPIRAIAAVEDEQHGPTI